MSPQQYSESGEKIEFLRTGVSKTLILADAVLAVVYFLILMFWFERGNMTLFYILMAGEVFHVWQLFTHLYTIWNTDWRAPKNESFLPPVDVFITVAGEPVDVVEETVRASLSMDYPDFRVHVLNDGFVAHKENWRDVELLVRKLGANCITRTIPGGAKAGNINHALSLTSNPYVAVFDADHVPHKDFLRKMMPYFADKKVAFAQSPQFYKNHGENAVTQGSWDQQALFFGAICKGKNRLNAATMCGTNMVIRRSALKEVGGMCEWSIAEDFLTGIMLHERGWKSVYVPEVLAEGLAPEDFLSYYKQQYRWARGALDVVFRHNLIFSRRLTFAQKVQYLSSVSYFVSGLVVVMNALIPIIFLFTGATPFVIPTMLLAIVFLPYIFLTIYIIQRSSNFSFTWRSLAFSMASFPIHIQALWSVLSGRKATFNVTSKKAIQGSFLYLTVPHILYMAVASAAFGLALVREGLSPSVISNMAWVFVNVAVFMEFVSAAAPRRAPLAAPAKVQKRVMSEIRTVTNA